MTFDNADSLIFWRKVYLAAVRAGDAYIAAQVADDAMKDYDKRKEGYK